MDISFVPVEGVTDHVSLIPSLLPWVHTAGNPYYDWLFGTAARAEQELSRWMARPTSEVAVSGVIALLTHQVLAGGYIAWPAEELPARRWADAQAAHKAFAGPERQALRSRLAAAAELFPPPEPHSYYLSRIGVLEPHRGKGLGAELLERYLSDGAALGHASFSLDVAVDNFPAIALYRRMGFVQTAVRSSSDGRLTYFRFLKGRPG